MATDAQRRHMRDLMWLLYQRRGQVHYRQARPMDWTAMSERGMRATLSRGGGLWADCSEAVTGVCRWAGLRDPNGFGYSGWGNSGTMWSRLPHYTTPSHAHVGALVTFGSGGWEHVAMVYTPGADPLLWSHGSEDGPGLIRLSQAKPWLARPVTLLDIGRL